MRTHLSVAFELATRVLAFEHAFAGRTVPPACITDKAAYRVGLPAMVAVDYLPFFDAENSGSERDAPEGALGWSARYPNQHAHCGVNLCRARVGSSGSAAFGLSCGSARPQKIAVVVDEVQTFGRTSRLFAFQHFGLEQFVDVVTTGKMLQVCATLFTDAMKPGPGLLSQTFTASTSAIVAAGVIFATRFRRISSGKAAEHASTRAVREAVRRDRCASGMASRAHMGWAA